MQTGISTPIELCKIQASMAFECTLCDSSHHIPVLSYEMTDLGYKLEGSKAQRGILNQLGISSDSSLLDKLCSQFFEPNCRKLNSEVLAGIQLNNFYLSINLS